MAINYQAAVNITATFQGQQAVKQAELSFGNLNRTINAIPAGIDFLAGAAKVLVTALAVREVVQFGKALIDMGDNLNDLRTKTGIGVQALSDLKAAAEDGGSSFESLQVGLNKFSVNLTAAKSGAKDAISAFQAAGVSLRDIRTKESGELLLQLSDRFAKLKDGPEKAALAVKIFGKSGAELIPVLNGGRDAIEGLGVQMSEDFVRQSDHFNDEMNRLKRTTESFGVAILEKVLPSLNKLFDRINDGASALKNNTSLFEKLFKFAGAAFSGSEEEVAKLAEEFGKDAAAAVEKEQKKRDEREAAISKQKKTQTVDADKVTDSRRNELEAIQKFLIAQDQEIESRRAEILTTDKLSDAYQKNQIALKIRSEAEKASVGYTEEGKKAFKEAAEEVIKYKQELVDLERQQKSSFGRGASEALNDYLEKIRDVAAQSRALFTGAFDRIEDSLANFVKKGKLDFAELSDFIQTELIKIAIRQAVLQPLLSGAQSIVPSLVSAAGSVAVASAGAPAAGTGGAIAPAAPTPTLARASVGGQNHVSVTVNMSGADEANASSARARSLGSAISNAVKQELAAQKRPGGLLYG